MAEKRIANKQRKTAETEIELTLNLDGEGKAEVDTGVPFLDHLLTLWTAHGLFDLEVKARGDLAVDYHHLVEDLGIVLGQAFLEALGDKRGIVRYASMCLPMDETLVQVAVDISNRPLLVYEVGSRPGFVRDFNVGLIHDFFQGFVSEARLTLHVNRLRGEEPHHGVEAVFKGVGRILSSATRIDERRAGQVVSTKGTLTD